jgi:hypothetical protein
MRALLGFVSLILVLGIGYYFYAVQSHRSVSGLPPKEQIDLAGVRADLLSLAQTERLFMAANGSYGSLEEVQRFGNLSFSTSNRGYLYAIKVESGSHFRITANPSEPSKLSWPKLMIDETMQISVQR